MTNWPDKESAEFWELAMFIRGYARLPHGVNFEMVRKNDRPDFLIENVEANEKCGLEVTSVYSSDHSVQDHKKMRNLPLHIHKKDQEITSYFARVKKCIKARSRSRGVTIMNSP